MRHTQFVMHQILHAIQIQHDTSAACAAAGQKKSARVFEAKGNQVLDDLDHDLCSHERKHVVWCSECPGAAPAIARAVRNETVETATTTSLKSEKSCGGATRGRLCDGQYLHVIRTPKEWILVGIRREYSTH